MPTTPAAETTPSQLPHLAGEHEDFVALADAFCIHESIHIPMHTLILGRESRVLAQLFNSLKEESSKRDAPHPLGEAKIFAGEDLETVLLTLYLLYNPSLNVMKETMYQGIKSEVINGASVIPLPPAGKAPGLWQATMRSVTETQFHEFNIYVRKQCSHIVGYKFMRIQYIELAAYL